MPPVAFPFFSARSVCRLDGYFKPTSIGSDMPLKGLSAYLAVDCLSTFNKTEITLLYQRLSRFKHACLLCRGLTTLADLILKQFETYTKML